MNQNLLWQLMQGMTEQSEQIEAQMQEQLDASPLPPPFDTLYMLRPMLPKREQRFVDILIKMQELKMLIAEVSDEI